MPRIGGGRLKAAIINGVMAFFLDQPIPRDLILLAYAILVVFVEFARPPEVPLWASILVRSLFVAIPFAFLIVYLSHLSPERWVALTFSVHRGNQEGLIRLLSRKTIVLLNEAIGDNSTNGVFRSILAKLNDRDRVPTRGHISRKSDEISLLFGQLASYFEISHEELQRVMKMSIAYVRRATTEMIDLRESLGAAHSPAGVEGRPVASWDGRRTARRERLRTSLHDEVDHLTYCLNHAEDIVRVIRDCVREPSTGQACMNAARILWEAAGDNARTGAICRQLLGRTGVPLGELLRVRSLAQRLQDKKIDELTLRSYYACVPEMLLKSMEEMVDHAKRAIVQISGKVTVVTFGYSSAVLNVLRNVSGSIVESVIVVEPDYHHGSPFNYAMDDAKHMERGLHELNNAGLSVHRMFMGVFKSKLDEKVWEGRKLRLFLGAENIRRDGTVVHPRGRFDLVRTVSELRRDVVVDVFAEEYKVIDLEASVYASPEVTCLQPGAYKYLYTSAGVFEWVGGIWNRVHAGGQRDKVDSVGAEGAWEGAVNGWLKDKDLRPVFD